MHKYHQKIHEALVLSKIREYLPWVLQRLIMDLTPRLPRLPIFTRLHLKQHLETRYCRQCGSILPRHTRRYVCLCKHRRHRWKDPTRRWKVYCRPPMLVKACRLTTKEAHRLWHNNFWIRGDKYNHSYFIMSRQSDVVYDIRPVIRKSRRRAVLCYNACTFLRYPYELFVPALGRPSSLCTFSAYKINCLWYMLQKELGPDEPDPFFIDSTGAIRYEPLPALLGKSNRRPFEFAIDGKMVRLPGALAKTWLTRIDLVSFLHHQRYTGCAATRNMNM